MRRPNVVWILSDQHAFTACGCYGNGVVRTPNIDALAADGTRFDCAYTPSPMCVPARDAILSGCYPHSFVRGNDLVPPPDLWMAPHHFRDAGYLTAHVGKLHPIRPYTRGFDYLVDMGHYFDYLGPKTEVFVRGMDARNSGCGCPMNDGPYHAHEWPKAVVPAYSPSTPQRPWRVAGWLGPAVNPTLPRVLDEPDHLEAFVARTCDAFIHENKERPFFLQASFLKPHYPEVSPPQYHALYPQEAMTLPADHLAWQAVPPRYRKQVFDALATSEGLTLARQWLSDYYASITYMDECVGRVIASLKAAGVYDDTIIFYTTDHGEMMFHHGMRGKGVFFEASARVPLIARVPGVVAGTSDALVDLTDLLPTSLSLCGVQPRRPCDGTDVSAVINNKAPGPRDACFSELHDTSMVRTRRWKLCRYGADDYQLFDLERDAGETESVYAARKDGGEIRALRERLERFSASR